MKCRRKPIEVEAFQWLGDNTTEIKIFGGASVHIKRYESEWILYVETPEGIRCASVEDYIIKDENGEYGLCTPSAFERMYEKVGEKY